MQNWLLGLYTNEQLSRFTNEELGSTVTRNCVTDRTLKDVERWKQLRDKGWSGMTAEERREWLGEITPTPAASKGMYSYRDLNRVERITEFIAIRLRAFGHILPDMTHKMDWTYTDVFTIEDMERYLNNIAVIREPLLQYLDVPEVPKTSDRFDFNLANDIEKILVAVDELSGIQSEPRYFVGELFSGEV